MMGTNDRRYRIRKLNPLQNFRSNDRMDLHLLEFFRSQPAGLGNNVFRHGQLADIVKNGGGLNRFQFQVR